MIDKLPEAARVVDEVRAIFDKLGATPEDIGAGFGLGLEEMGLELTTRLRWDRVNGAVSVRAIYKSGGVDVLYLDRQFSVRNGKVQVDHALFEVDEAYQGAGLAKTVLANSVEMYRTLGVAKITLKANIDVGGYAWAKYGFRHVPGGGAAVVAAKAQRIADALEDSDVAVALDKVANVDNPSMMWDLADMTYRRPGAEHHLGKELLLSRTWDGELLLDDSEAMLRFATYVGLGR